MQTPELGRPPRPTGDVEAAPPTETAGPELLETVYTAIYWDNPAVSGILCLLGAMTAVAGDYIFKGKHGLPLLSGDTAPDAR